MTKDQEIAKAFLETIGISNLVSSLESGKAQLERLSLLSIYNLCEGIKWVKVIDLDNIVKLRDRKLINSVVALLDKSSPGLSIKTIIALSYGKWNISRFLDKENCKMILETNTIERIINFMKSEEPEISQVAKSAIFLFKNHSKI